jgi:hypothetical protein
MISIITTSMGRELYLQRTISALIINKGNEEIEHYIGFINNSFETLTQPMVSFLLGYQNNNIGIKVHIVQYKDLAVQQMYLNDLIPRTVGDVIVKLDDDTIIRSDHYFDHVRAIYELKPECIFSPFPVGLIGNFGGVQSTDRHVVYSEKMNTYYTFRKVPHVGGFARIVPATIAKSFKWSQMNEGEDTVLSKNHNHIPKYYLENALIVEHCESSLGQTERYKNTYRGIILG